MDINSRPRPARHKSIAMSEGMRGKELFYTQSHMSIQKNLQPPQSTMRVT